MPALATLVKSAAHVALPWLPTRVLTPILRTRPYLASKIPAGRSFVFPRHGGDIAMWVDNGNAIEHAVLSEQYDPDVAAAIQRFVRPGQICVDVGANVGAVSLILARAVGPHGRVLAIEPGPPYLTRLQQNLALNPELGARIHVVAVGVGERLGTLTWEADPAHPYNAVVGEKPWGTTGAGVTVPIETLDALVARFALPRVDFIKIDVEGMELDVLRGAFTTLQTHRPVVIFESMVWARTFRQQVAGIDIFDTIRVLLDRVQYVGASPDGRSVDWSHLGDNTLALPYELA